MDNLTDQELENYLREIFRRAKEVYVDEAERINVQKQNQKRMKRKIWTMVQNFIRRNGHESNG